MAKGKGKKAAKPHKQNPSSRNDQIGENAGEGRMMQGKSGKK